jgi:hypothetical protein
LETFAVGDAWSASCPRGCIRGSKARLPENYLTALDRVLDIRPEWLLGSHIMPIQGKDYITDTVAATGMRPNACGINRIGRDGLDVERRLGVRLARPVE